MASTRLLTLGSGHTLAIDETGDPAGQPVFFFHGWPASRLQGAGFSREAEEFGVRIISPDRPGIGLSSIQPGRQLLDWPPIIREVAEQLGFERFRVLAISGGGPYAFATAYALREQVEAISVVSGAPPLGPETDPAALLAVYRWLLFVFRRQPALVRALFQAAAPLATLRPPERLWPLLLRFVPAADREALRDPSVFEGSFACYREAWRGSGAGVVSDAAVYATAWGFAPEEVRVPVQLWHGKNDRSFGWELAAELASKLPHCEARFVEGEGHYSLPIRHRREILGDLLGATAVKP